MLKQEAFKRIFSEFVTSRLVDIFSKYGFQYVKTKRAFRKSIGEFDYLVSCGYGTNPLYFDETNEQLQFFFVMGAKLEFPKYEKWYKKTFQKDFRAWAAWEKLPRVFAWFPVLFNQFESSDFYEPTNSQKFKMYISGVLGGDRPQGDDLQTALHNLETLLLPYFDQFKTWDDLLANDLYYPVQKIDFLLYAGKKDDYQKACIDWCKNTLGLIQEAKANNSDHLQHHQEALQEMNRKYQLIFQQDLLASMNYELLSYEKKDAGPGFSFAPGWEWESVFKIDNISPRITTIDIDLQNRQVIIGHASKLTSLWDFEGNKLKEVEIPYGIWMDDVAAGYIAEMDCYYVNSFLYDKQFNKIASLPDLGLHKGKDTIAFFPTIFNDCLLIASRKETAMYYKSGKLIKKEENKFGELTGLFPDTKRLLYYKGDEYYILDKDFNHILTLPSNKSNNLEATPISSNAQYLFAGGYYTKAYLYDFSKNGARQVLWAHETFKEGYKDNYKVSHNFGINVARFSPDNSYLVVGADHAKQVVWELPSLKRTELAPEPEFTFEGAPPNTESANNMRQIEFFDNGNFFCTIIRGHALLWDRNLKQLGKTSDAIKIKFSAGQQYALKIHDWKSFTFYKRK